MTEHLRTRAPTAAIVLNWNGMAFIGQSLRDLASSTVPIDVIVVDNGSTDGGAEFLRARGRPGLEVVFLPRNLGFTGGMNVGLRRAAEAGYEYVWLLNNDISVPPDTHGRLLARLTRSSENAILTPALRMPSGEMQHVGGSYACDGSSTRLLVPETFDLAPAHSAWLTATALFCRLSTALRIGPFDEAFFTYWEDVDWSFRARRIGIRLEVAPDITITHHGGQGTGAYGSALTAYLMARNELLFLRRHTRGRARRAAMTRVIARQLRWAMLLDRRGHAVQARGLFGGVLAGLLAMRGAPRRVAVPRFVATALLARPLLAAHWLDRWAKSLDTPHAGSDQPCGASDATSTTVPPAPPR